MTEKVKVNGKGGREAIEAVLSHHVGMSEPRLLRNSVSARAEYGKPA